MGEYDVKRYWIQEIANDSARYAFEPNSEPNSIAGDIDNFNGKLHEILNASCENNARQSVTDFISLAMSPHGDKNKIMGPTAGLIRVVELRHNKIPEDLRKNHKEQRLHYLHSVNVFLLGLIIYENCPKIRENIHNEILKTTRVIPKCGHDTNPYIFSSGSIKGEFLYRWRFASLCHDIGYIITLEKDEKPKEGIKLLQLQDIIEQSINKVDDLEQFEKKYDLKKSLNSKLKRINLQQYIEKFKEIHYDDFYYEHGLTGAFLFLWLMYDNFKKYSRSKSYPIENGTCVHRTLLKTSVLQVAKAIALHNIEKSNDSWKAAVVNKDKDKSFKLYPERDALACLLKICDNLQEWDKPINPDDSLDQKSFDMEFHANKILLRNFPKEEEFKKILKYMNGYEDLFVFQDKCHKSF